MPAPPPPAAAALLDVLDGLSRGLNHALSNRVNTLNTLLAVLQDCEEFDREIVDALAAEEARFESLLQLYRLFPLDVNEAREPLILADPVADALALFAHHLDLRMLPCEVSGLESAPPVRCQRRMLTQAILVMLVAVGRAMSGDDQGPGLNLSIRSRDDQVILHAGTARDADSEDANACVALNWLASTIGAAYSCGRDDLGRPWVELALPTLAAERKGGR